MSAHRQMAAGHLDRGERLGGVGGRGAGQGRGPARPIPGPGPGVAARGRVLYADETPARVGGRLHYMHVACTGRWLPVGGRERCHAHSSPQRDHKYAARRVRLRAPVPPAARCHRDSPSYWRLHHGLLIRDRRPPDAPRDRPLPRTAVREVPQARSSAGDPVTPLALLRPTMRAWWQAGLPWPRSRWHSRSSVTAVPLDAPAVALS